MESGPGGVWVVASQWLLIGIAFAIIAARLWLRIMIQHRRLWASDILMLLAWVASVVTALSDIIFFRMGALEPHVDTFLTTYDGTPEEIKLILEIFWISSIPFYVTFYLCKAALLATFLQLFPRFMTRRRVILWAVVAFTAASFVISILYHTLGCVPVQRNWGIGDEDTCPTQFTGNSFRLAWALHFSSDLFIFALPWLILPDLQLKNRMKAGIYGTFLLGAINLSFCIVRFATIQSADNNGRMVPLSLVDLWSSLDCNITLVIACLPSLRPYLRSRKTIMEPSNQYTGGRYVSSTGVRKSAAVAGLSQRGFEPLDEERNVDMNANGLSVPGTGGVMRTTTIHVHREPSVSSDLAPGDAWARDDGEKSDIELVTIPKPAMHKSEK